MANHQIAIFLSGPVGVGKSTLGQALAQAIGGHFVDGDDHAPSDKPWYASSRSTHEAIFREIVTQVAEHRLVVVAYPLRRTEWIFYKHRLDRVGVVSVFISLRATVEAITAADRGRQFTEWELRRIPQMIEQGYDKREFSDLTIETGNRPIDQTLEALMQKLAASGCFDH